MSSNYFDLTLRPDGTLFIFSHRISVGPYWCKIDLSYFHGRYKSVRIGGYGKKICYEAFPHQSIPELYLEDKIDTIGAKAFAFCTDMRSARLSMRLYEIEECAFRHCTSLERIVIPPYTRILGERVFYECSSLREAVFQTQQLRELPKGTFENCTCLEKVALPRGLDTIGEEAFKGCSLLETIEIPESVTELGDYAFRNCVCLEEVWIPPKAKFNITTFWGCRSLRRIDIALGHPTYRSTGDMVLSRDGDTVCFAAGGISGSRAVPDGVRHINSCAFMCCFDLKSLRLPDSVQDMGTSCFKFSSSLEEVVLPARLEVLPEGTFYGCRRLARIVLPESLKSIQDEAFYDSGLEEVVLPAGIQTLGKGCFGKTPLKRLVVLGDSLEFLNPRSIPAACALRADNVPLEQIPSALQKAMVRDYVLRKDAGEPVSEALETWSLAYLKGHVQALWKEPVFRNQILCNGFITARAYLKIMEMAEQEKDLELTARLLQYREDHGLGPQLVRLEDNRAKRELRPLDKKPSATELRKLWKLDLQEDGSAIICGYKGDEEYVTVPAKIGNTVITGIARNSFSCSSGATEKVLSGRRAVRSIVVSEGIQTLDYAAFSNCCELQSLTLPEGLQTIQFMAFSYTKLSEIEIPQSVTEVDGDAFMGCPLKKIVFRGAQTAIGAQLGKAFPDGAEIWAPEGSPAQRWAQDYGIPFHPLPASGSAPETDS